MSDKQRYCRGCIDDFYNGNNELGVAKCWSLKTATVVKMKFVHIDQCPPWNQKAETTLSCHRRQRYVAVKPEQTR